MSAEGYIWRATDAARRNPNVMEVGLVPGAGRKRPCASFDTILKCRTTHVPGSPYVQQQKWLISDLPNLYRLATTGDRWPGDQVIFKLNGQPFIDDMLSRLSALSQGPVIPSPFLPSSPFYDGSNQKPSISGCMSTLELFMGRIWEPRGLPDVGQIVEGFINPLSLQRMGDSDEKVTTQIDEHRMTTGNKNRFSGDPDMLLFELSAYMFTSCVPS
ncbi:hypothetical protein PENSTE_c022G00239 [Penicillium steckii]|uniref:Uncharacterized protein n=1 Tax=Penicillium steckii TaxID=303698 RepID=A0A1V6STF5_9EURO|nr:hypothetical protein PENSTE_c022G00239 [Penicillium steckii]